MTICHYCSWLELVWIVLSTVCRYDIEVYYQKIVQLDPNMRTQHSTATLKDPIIVAQNNAHSPVMMPVDYSCLLLVWQCCTRLGCENSSMYCYITTWWNGIHSHVMIATVSGNCYISETTKQMFISEIGLYKDYDWTLCGHTQAPTPNWFGLVCSHCIGGGPSRTWHSKRRFEGYVWVCWWMMRYSFEFYNEITAMKEITRQVLLYTDCDWMSSQIYRFLTLSNSGSFDPIGLLEDRERGWL